MEVTIKFKDDDVDDIEYHLNGKKAFYALSSLRAEASNKRRQYEKADNNVAEIFWSEFIELIDDTLCNYEVDALVSRGWS